MAIRESYLRLPARTAAETSRPRGRGDVTKPLALIASSVGLTRSAMRTRVAPSWGSALVAIIVLFIVALGSQPEPSRPPTATEELIGNLLFGGIFLSLAAGAAATYRRSRWGLAFTLPITAFLVFTAITCPLSGHHPWGAWVMASYGSTLAAGGLHLYALAKTKPAQGAATK